jgi:hypothetical protein
VGQFTVLFYSERLNSRNVLLAGLNCLKNVYDPLVLNIENLEVRTYICIHIYIHIHTYAYTCTQMIYTCVYTCVYANIHIHIHIHTYS